MGTRILPDKAELQKLLALGLTHKEIAEKVTRDTGHPVRRSSVSAAVSRAGMSGPNKKYEHELPWTVKEEHLTHYAARMLRLLGRRNAGIRNSEEMDQRLNAWLELLRRNDAVVTYLPDTIDGFFYVDGEPDSSGIPIRVEPDI